MPQSLICLSYSAISSARGYESGEELIVIRFIPALIPCAPATFVVVFGNMDPFEVPLAASNPGKDSVRSPICEEAAFDQ